jgi:hypothetical protein
MCLQSTDHEVVPGLGGEVGFSAPVGGLLAVVGTTGLLLVGATDCCTTTYILKTSLRVASGERMLTEWVVATHWPQNYARAHVLHS